MAKKTGKTCSKVFTQYHQRNDWGSIFYSDALHQKFVAEVGDAIRVRFPDGHERTMLLGGKEHSEMVQDMQNRYPVVSTLYGFHVDHHGIKVWLPLEEVEVATVW